MSKKTIKLFNFSLIVSSIFLLALSSIYIYSESDDISRLYNFTTGTVINPSQVNGEFNQLVNTSNGKAGRDVDQTMSGDNTFSGANIFSGATSFTGVATFSEGTTPIKTDIISERSSATGVTIDGVLLKDSQATTDVINEKNAGNGVTADSVLLKDGMVTVAGVADANGKIGYDSNQFQGYRNGGLKNFLMAGDGKTLLDTQTASSSATLDFTTGINSTYDHYTLECGDIVPATDNVDLQMLISDDGGSTWEADAADYKWDNLIYGNGNTSATGAGDLSDPFIRIVTGLGSDTAESGHLKLEFWNPDLTTNSKRFIWDMVYAGQASSANFRVSGSAMSVATTAINGIQLKMSSGNIEAGFCKLYGE